MTHNSKLRNKAFLSQCRKSAAILSKKGRPSASAIINHALAQPAPSYFVDPDRAVKIMLGQLAAPADGGESERLWADFRRDFARARKRHPHTSPRDVALLLCVGREGNPRFYLSRRRAVEIASHVLYNFD